jgi:hypothetical protein
MPIPQRRTLLPHSDYEWNYTPTFQREPHSNFESIGPDMLFSAKLHTPGSGSGQRPDLLYADPFRVSASKFPEGEGYFNRGQRPRNQNQYRSNPEVVLSTCYLRNIRYEILSKKISVFWGFSDIPFKHCRIVTVSRSKLACYALIAARRISSSACSCQSSGGRRSPNF